MRGTTRKLRSYIMWLREPRLLVACNVHVSWNYTTGSTRMESTRVEVATRIVEAHTWNYTRVQLYTYVLSSVKLMEHA